MSDTLEIFGKEFTNVAGFKAKDNNGNTLTYTRGGSGGGTITIEEIPNATGTTLQITTNGSGGGGTPSATQHTIHLEFSDETDADIDVYYDDALIGTMITNYTPNPWTYNNKIVYYASLDNVEWLDNTETWETLFDGNVDYYKNDNSDYPYCWISSLGNTPIVVGDTYKVTYNNIEYQLVATLRNDRRIFGNPVYGSFGDDDGSGVPFIFSDLTQYGAWSGAIDAPNQNFTISIKIEHKTS